MSYEPIIQVENLSKCFSLYNHPLARLKEVFNKRPEDGSVFWALKNVSFEILRGQTVGILGENGSGKSTLLQIIAGLMKPTEGEVQTKGRIAALLELGSGFNPEFTGRQNVYLNGSLLGLSNQEINDKFDAIAAFADIGMHLDQPVKTYSSGMIVRLAFAVQVFVEAEILIIDEALAVGDSRFQLKCFNHLDKLKVEGTTILFVSHAYDLVKSFCDFGLVLKKGAPLYWGDANTATTKYLASLFPENENSQSMTPKETKDNSEIQAQKNLEIATEPTLLLNKDTLKKSWGYGGVTIEKVAILGLEHPNKMQRGKTLRIFLKASLDTKLIDENSKKYNCIGNLIFGVRFDNQYGVPIFDAFHEIELVHARSDKEIELKFEIKVPEIRGGDYFLSFGAAIGKVNQVIPLFSSDNAALLVLESDEKILGIMNPEYTCARIEAWDI